MTINRREFIVGTAVIFMLPPKLEVPRPRSDDWIKRDICKTWISCSRILRVPGHGENLHTILLVLGMPELLEDVHLHLPNNKANPLHDEAYKARDGLLRNLGRAVRDPHFMGELRRCEDMAQKYGVMNEYGEPDGIAMMQAGSPLKNILRDVLLGQMVTDWGYAS